MYLLFVVGSNIPTKKYGATGSSLGIYKYLVELKELRDKNAETN